MQCELNNPEDLLHIDKKIDKKINASLKPRPEIACLFSPPIDLKTPFHVAPQGLA